MTLCWTDFPDAPAPGTVLCYADGLAEGVTSCTIAEFPVLLVCDAEGVRAFVNACPHQFLPLDARGSVASADGRRLVCSNHDAVFDARTGAGVAGFGLNCALSPVPIRLQGDAWVIGEVAPSA